eukprot:364937-Chlamydomonas_euryale.AAC.32
MELAAGTLQMFAGRPAAYGHLLAAGAVPVMVRLLSPLYPESVVVHMANAVGAMAEDFEARLAVRQEGVREGLRLKVRGEGRGLGGSVQDWRVSGLGCTGNACWTARRGGSTSFEHSL